MGLGKSAALIAAPVTVIAISLIFIGVRSDHPQPVLLSGTVETAHIDVASKIPGRIDSLFVREGDMVSKGSVLVKLQSKEMLAKVEQARGTMEAARAKLTMAINGLRPQEKDAVQKMYSQSKAQYDLLEKTWTRIRKLYEDSVISLQERDQIEAQFTGAKEQMDAAKSKWDMAKEGTRVEDREAAQSLYYQAQNGYIEAMAYADELIQKSPINGEVEKTVAHSGEIVAAGYPIITLIDTSDKWIVVQVKETAMTKFKMGNHFKGTVPALGKTLDFKVCYISPMADFATWRPTNQKGEFDVRTFEIHLRPVGDQADLRPGMTVNFTL